MKKHQKRNQSINERSFHFFFWKFIYSLTDHLLPRSDFPGIGRLFCKIRVANARHISPNISKKAIIQKGALIRPEIFVGDYGMIGKNCRTDRNLHIGEHVLMGPNVHFYTTFHRFDSQKGYYSNDPLPVSKAICVGNGSWIGYGAIILGGVQIGERSVIGAGSVVTKNVPNDSLAAGNPAEIKKHYNATDRD